MVDHLNVSYLYKKRGVFYFHKRVPCDVKSYHKSDRIVICLRTKSNGVTFRASKSICRKCIKKYKSLVFDNKEKLIAIYVSHYINKVRANNFSLFNRDDFD